MLNYLWAFMMLVGILWAALHGQPGAGNDRSAGFCQRGSYALYYHAGRYVILDGDFRGGQESRTD